MRGWFTSRRNGAPAERLVTSVLRRDRAVVAAALAAVVVLAWTCTILGAGTGMSAIDMTRMNGWPGLSGMAMPAVHWTPGYFALMVGMWWMMMAAMMLPAAAPMLLLFAQFNRRQIGGGGSYVPTAVFAAGYLLVWGALSIAAALLQVLLSSAGLLDPVMQTQNLVFAGGVLIMAGAYQLTPLKEACLSTCRSPLAFVMQHLRAGHGGAMRMGAEHGLYCVGCCWALMALLFVFGIMNLWWIGGLALLVLIEKTMPAGRLIGRAVGVCLVLGGVVMLAQSVI